MKNLSDITKLVSDFISQSPLNIVNEHGNMKIYGTPLVGIASADDSLFEGLKGEQVVGPHHMSPQEWLPGAKSVVSVFLPYTDTVRKSNYIQGYPSTEWLYGRYEGEACNKALRRFLEERFNDLGVNAVAPMDDPRYKIIDRRSNWSERHAAFIAGLGTFSLNRSVITRKGSAGRFGSVITDMELEATPRLYSELYEYCTMCNACIDRCPVGAITETGKDHRICHGFLDETLAKHTPRYGCGKCQTAVPCECSIPGTI